MPKKKRSQSKINKQQKLSQKPQPSTYIVPEAWNGFRLIKQATQLGEAELSGDLRNLPITITYSFNTPATSDVLPTHPDVMLYAMSLLVDMGFSTNAATNIVFDSKATKDTVRNMFSKR